MRSQLSQLLVLLVGLIGQPVGADSGSHNDSNSDVAAGMNIYVRCTGCHAPAYHRTGPRHCDLIGRRAGSIDGFEFTPQMKNSGIVWNAATLDRFLTAPLAMIPGTSMGFAGIASADERSQLISFLGSLTQENPLCR